jgi:hypothetical protein
MHYKRWWRHGSTDLQPHIKDLKDLFWAKVNKDGGIPPARQDLGSCWVWTGFLDRDGYGLFANKRTGTNRAHRWSYVAAMGDIAPDLVIDHLCRNRACVRPDHLEPVTNKVNAERGIIAQKTHCIRGHEFTARNTYIKPNGTRCCRDCRNTRNKTPEARAKHAEAERRRRANLRENTSGLPGRGDAATTTGVTA